MDAIARLEARIRSLETSRGRSRLAAGVLGLMLAGVSAAAMVPQTAPSPQEAQTVGALSTQRITLTGVADADSIVLVAGPNSSLVIQAANGKEIARIGGMAARYTR